MRATGAVNVVGLLLFAAIGTAIWLLVLFTPAYLDNLDVSEAVRGAFAEANRVPDSASIRRIQEAGLRIGTHVENDTFGNEVVRPGLRWTDDQITITRDEVRHYVEVRLDYDRDVLLWPLNKVHRLHFVNKKEGLLSQ